MQRGRFLILIGILLAVMAVGLLLLMSRDEEEKPAETKEPGEVTLVPTAVPPTPVPTDRVVVAQQRIPRGPLLVTGRVVVRAGSGRIAWRGTKAALCRCGASQNKPFCDGAHAKAGFEAE